MTVVRSLVGLCLLAVGCVSGPPIMVELRPPQPLQARPDAAMVVFIRPSIYAWAVTADVMDEAGRFVGRMVPNGNFAVNMAPGRHMFTIWAENTDVLTVDVAAGHIYFVESYLTPGMFSAQFHLRAIKPALPNWAARDQWMQRTRMFTVDQAAGQARLNAHGAGAIQERLRRAEEHYAKYGPDEQFTRSITPGDGI
jgi:hypothetical protein